MRHFKKLILIAMIYIMIAVNIQASGNNTFVSSDIRSLLSTLKNSKNIRIFNSENKRYSGRFIKADSSTVTMRIRRRIRSEFQDIPLSEIDRIYYNQKSSVVIVVASGVTGFIIGYAIGDSISSAFWNSPKDYTSIAYGAGIGLAIGALVGIVIRNATSKWILLFEQPNDLTYNSSHKLNLNILPDKNGGAKLALSLNF